MHDARLAPVLLILHYIYPTLVFVYFAISCSFAVCTLQTTSEAAKTRHCRLRAIIYLLAAFLLVYVAQIITEVINVIIARSWPTQDSIIGLLACILVFGIEFNSLINSSSVVWYPLYGSWVIAAVFEPTIAAIALTADPRNGPRHMGLVEINAILSVIRSLIAIGTIVVYFTSRTVSSPGDEDREQEPLLAKPDNEDENRSSDSGYGTNTENNTKATNSPTTSSPNSGESPWERQQRVGRQRLEDRLKSEGNWLSYVKGFMVFFPYVWPVHNRRLQIYAVLVGLCLISGNVLNFLIPRQLGAVMDSLSGVNGKSPWTQVLIFSGLRLLASEAGISLLRQFLWMPVEFYSAESLTIAAYSHVMNLSSEFHDSKSSSDLMVAISRGRSVSNMLESICFSALPMMIDLVVAFSYLSAKFGPYEGFITIATGTAFVQAAAQMVSGFQGRRQKMVKTYFEEHYIKQAGIQGWHTVSAFNQVPHEERRYEKAVKANVDAQKEIYSGYLTRQALQYLILLAGLLAGSFLAVYQVTNGQATAGDFVMLLTYWSQLTSPLKYFSALGKNISQDMVEAERLLDLMLTKPTIVDKPLAKPLNLKGGKVDLKNVSFSYDKQKRILNDVTLSVSPGQTVAFVGATGAGKSTILKLLDRFYDVTAGSILIDGQDVRDVTLTSVRQSVGIVPQAPILFDDTVMNNVRYARLTATDEEVYSACKAAAMHDQIMGFTEGYQTRVGERGVKLSGGELQRIAIARAILKQPYIVLLDEATSSVDTDTEQKIQDGLRSLCEGRTTFIVAHRLSTVMNADTIFVVSDGEIKEQGNHEELVARKGKYAELWSKQIFTKPKDRKQDDDQQEDDQVISRGDAQEDGPADSSTNEDRDTRKTASNGCEAASETGEASEGGMTNGGKTPKGHKRESSRLNPGAPEFTPRSVNTRSLAHPSPTKSNWADDVESENKSPCKSMKNSIPVLHPPVYRICSIDDPHNVFVDTAESRVTETLISSPQGQCETEINAEPISERSPRRRTAQSLSCPDRVDSDSDESPSRSFSQPIQPPISTAEACSVDAVKTRSKSPTQERCASSVKPVTERSKSPPHQPHTRARGGPRGRGFRGRNRGGGRGKRNTSIPTPTTTALPSQSHTTRPRGK